MFMGLCMISVSYSVLCISINMLCWLFSVDAISVQVLLHFSLLFYPHVNIIDSLRVIIVTFVHKRILY